MSRCICSPNVAPSACNALDLRQSDATRRKGVSHKFLNGLTPASSQTYEIDTDQWYYRII